MNDQGNRLARLRYTAIGALAALAVAGAIAGTAALAAGTTKAPAPGNAQGTNNPFVIAVQRLVSGGTITPAQAQALDREILTGNIDTQSLAASGFTQSQLQTVQQTLANTKRALVTAHPGTAKPNAPSPAGPGKAAKPQPDSAQPFLAAVQRLVNDGTISSAEGQVLDREILTGSLDTHTLAASGFTQSQVQAVQQTLSNTKRALAG